MPSEPRTLKSRDIKGVAEYIKSGKCKRIFVMAGAGISTSAGIPDFRSPETGLYANLQRLNLPYAEAVFDIDYFRENPIPFYTLAKDMNPTKFRPTPTHTFFRLLDSKHLLELVFTQNIDTLERRAGLRGEKIIEAHGSFASNSCVDCRAPFEGDEMRECVERGEVARCAVCGGLVKPDIVFFGEGLPKSFFTNVPKLRSADLLFILGTSLTVMPFAGICQLVPPSCPRVLINLDAVGDIGSRPDDVLALGDCDTIVRQLCRELGWEEELERMWGETAGLGEVVRERDEVELITRDIGRALRLEEKVEEVVEEVLEEGLAGREVSRPVEEGAVGAEKGGEKEAKEAEATKEETPAAEKETSEKEATKTEVKHEPPKEEAAKSESIEAKADDPKPDGTAKAPEPASAQENESSKSVL